VNLFASELRHARSVAGLTQEAMAEAINYSPSLVAMVETGRRTPSREFAARADDALKLDGLLGRILGDLLARESTPDWFRPWVEIEREATMLRSYEPLVVPGLLQVPEYARALLRNVGESDDYAESRVATRMERQDILAGDNPPVLMVVIDEGVLRRPVGGPEVMNRQLRRLADAADRALIQVVPMIATTYVGLAGPFVIASVDGNDVVYLDTQMRGYVIDSHDMVSLARHRWDQIRAEALPRKASRELILEVAKTWES
jgi:transcriptional regulator with XRE-family HTH domain